MTSAEAPHGDRTGRRIAGHRLAALHEEQQGAGPHLPNKWRQATSSLRLTPLDTETALFRIVQRMEQLGGRLEVASGDQGTIVRGRLPLVNDAV